MSDYDFSGTRCQIVREKIPERFSSKASGSGNVAEMFSGMADLDREHALAVCVNAKLQIVSVATVSVGTLTASIVHPREVFKVAILANASAIIFIHNHPSGDPVPSDEDRRITLRLEEAGQLLGIPLLDSIIIGADGRHFSFADDGTLSGNGQQYRGSVLR